MKATNEESVEPGRDETRKRSWSVLKKKGGNLVRGQAAWRRKPKKLGRVTRRRFVGRPPEGCSIDEPRIAEAH